MDAPRATDAPALVANAADAIYLVDELGRVQYANPAALAILGYDDERELLGLSEPRDDPPFASRRHAVSRGSVPAARAPPDR